MRFGFELEHFVFKLGKKMALPPRDYSIPIDDCQYLVEARGKPSPDVFAAAGSVIGEMRSIEHLLREHKQGPFFLNRKIAVVAGLPADVKLELKKRGGGKKSGLAQRSLYEKGILDFPEGLYGAGLHIHFGFEENTFEYGKKKSLKFTYPRAEALDLPRFIRGLDERFENQIVKAKRRLGLYELKYHGFEYRSLPCTVDPLEVAEAIKHIQKEE